MLNILYGAIATTVGAVCFTSIATTFSGVNATAAALIYVGLLMIKPLILHGSGVLSYHMLHGCLPI